MSVASQRPRGPVALIYSPMAGSTHANDAQRLLERAGVPVALTLPVQSLNGAELQGAYWQEAGCVAAVAAGGDGTVGAVATHAAPFGLPVGILPYGTANDIARSLNIPLGFGQAAQTIAWGEPLAVDAGQVLYPHLPGVEAYFVHALTLGLNVEFARLATDVAQRRRWGRLTYAVSAFESLEHYKPLPAAMRFSGLSGDPTRSLAFECEIALMTAINLPLLGGSLGFRAPGVRSDDQLLDFIVVEASAPRDVGQALADTLNMVSAAAQIVVGRSDPTTMTARGVRWYRAQSLHIETNQAAGVTLDGELHRQTPAIVRVAPKPVWIFVPAARRLGETTASVH